jgi:hypothetical protein
MRELSRDEVDSVLVEVGYGFLGLARESTPYVLPMSFGYDGEALFFQMNSTGRKFDFISDATPASFAVLAIDQETGVTRSVSVDGQLREVPEERTQAAFDALAATANFGTDLELWGVKLQETDPRLYTLQPDSVSGRVYGEEDPVSFEDEG